MIPDKIKIGANIYPVTLDDSQEMKDENLLGEVGYTSLFIRIRADLPKERQQQTFIHELVHAMFFEAGTTFNIYDNEKIVRPLANMLHQVLKDNPKLCEMVE